MGPGASALMGKLKEKAPNIHIMIGGQMDDAEDDAVISGDMEDSMDEDELDTGESSEIEKIKAKLKKRYLTKN